MESQEKSCQRSHNDRENHTQHEEETMRRKGLLDNRSKQGLRYCPSVEEAPAHTVNNHKHEILVILEADAVHNPRTMVVHAQDTRTANAAMMTPVRLVHLAPFACATVTRDFELMRLVQRRPFAIKFPFAVARYRARANRDAKSIAEHEERHQHLRDDGVPNASAKRWG